MRSIPLKRSRIVAILGPRQCGKTTMARMISDASDCPVTFLDIDNPLDRNKLQNPMLQLGPLKGLVVLDEIQQAPELFPILRVLADRKPLPARFLVLGSASPDIIRGCSESLAGRVEFVFMNGFSLDEVEPDIWQTLWWRGGFPDAFLARSDADAQAWHTNFIRTFLERDLRNMGINIPPVALHRLWQMYAHYHGQVLNASELGRALAESYWQRGGIVTRGGSIQLSVDEKQVTQQVKQNRGEMLRVRSGGEVESDGNPAAGTD